jgi:uncharacterized protein YndB with AHSA1/START domain
MEPANKSGTLEKDVLSYEITISRFFDAPRDLCWKAWTDPDHLRRWWGPRGFTAPSIKSDFRVGGKYLYCMRSPSGEEYWSTGVFREIVPLERIVCTDSFSDKEGKVVPASDYGMQGDFPLELTVTVTFEDVNGSTKFVLRHAGFPQGDSREMAKDGWNQSLDKLEAMLTTDDSGGNDPAEETSC